MSFLYYSLHILLKMNVYLCLFVSEFLRSYMTFSFSCFSSQAMASKHIWKMAFLERELFKQQESWTWWVWSCGSCSQMRIRKCCIDYYLLCKTCRLLSPRQTKAIQLHAGLVWNNFPIDVDKAIRQIHGEKMHIGNNYKGNVSAQKFPKL